MMIRVHVSYHQTTLKLSQNYWTTARKSRNIVHYTGNVTLQTRRFEGSLSQEKFFTKFMQMIKILTNLSLMSKFRSPASSQECQRRIIPPSGDGTPVPNCPRAPQFGPKLGVTSMGLSRMRHSSPMSLLNPFMLPSSLTKKPHGRIFYMQLFSQLQKEALWPTYRWFCRQNHRLLPAVRGQKTDRNLNSFILICNFALFNTSM